MAIFLFLFFENSHCASAYRDLELGASKEKVLKTFGRDFESRKPGQWSDMKKAGPEHDAVEEYAYGNYLFAQEYVIDFDKSGRVVHKVFLQSP